jgi:hypothetical protein
VWLRESRTAGSISGIIAPAIGLVVCAFFLPGTTIDWRGVLIAIAVIDLPLIGIDRYILRVGGKHGRPRRLGRGAVALIALTVWVFVGPAVADWVTPHFNIGGVVQYVVLWLVILLLGLAYWRAVTALTHDPKVD